MANLTIKGIAPELLDQLSSRARQSRRSLNSEVLHLLESSVGGGPVGVDTTLVRIRRLQERTRLPPLTDDLLDGAINDGRP